MEFRDPNIGGDGFQLPTAQPLDFPDPRTRDITDAEALLVLRRWAERRESKNATSKAYADAFEVAAKAIGMMIDHWNRPGIGPITLACDSENWRVRYMSDYIGEGDTLADAVAEAAPRIEADFDTLDADIAQIKAAVNALRVGMT